MLAGPLRASETPARVFCVTTALYRRYRPETFEDVIGQEHVTEPLMTALRKNRVNHAYLFSGPRGCGKTTSARILARCLNCAEGPTATPCGRCESCRDLARDGAGSLDVIEMDAASHGGVDHARDLRERATFAPVRDRYKIFIIDEAHMVTREGFNALLKIVEEPPEHVKFIFATTEPSKVLTTIRSRTHHYPFRLVPPEPLMRYLEQLCQEEGVSTEPGVLSLVVRAGGGSVRDSLSVLDQLMAGSDERGISYDLAVALLGYTHAALLDDVVDAFAAGDAATVFSSVDRVVQTGQDPRRFVEDLLERFRDLVVVNAVPDSAANILHGMPTDQINRLRNQATQLGAAELSRSADITNEALNEMTGATSPQLHLELLCARILLPSADDTTRGITSRVDRLERRLSIPRGAGIRPGGPSIPPAPGAADGVDPAAPHAPGADAMAPVAPDSPSSDASAEPAREAADPAPSGPVRQDGSQPGRSAMTTPDIAEPSIPEDEAEDPRGSDHPAAGDPVPRGERGPQGNHPPADGTTTEHDAAGQERSPATGAPAGPSGSPASTMPSRPDDAQDTSGAQPRSGVQRLDDTRDGASGHRPDGRESAPRSDGQGSRGRDYDARGSDAPSHATAPGEDRAATPGEETGASSGARGEPDTAPSDDRGPAAPSLSTGSAGEGAGDDVNDGAAAGTTAASDVTSGELELLRSSWPEIVSALAEIRRVAWAITVRGTPISYENSTLRIAFEGDGDIMNFPRFEGDVRTAIQNVVGLDCAVEAVRPGDTRGQHGGPAGGPPPGSSGDPRGGGSGGRGPAPRSTGGPGSSQEQPDYFREPEGFGVNRRRSNPSGGQDSASPASRDASPAPARDASSGPSRSDRGQDRRAGRSGERGRSASQEIHREPSGDDEPVTSWSVAPIPQPGVGTRTGGDRSGTGEHSAEESGTSTGARASASESAAAPSGEAAGTDSTTAPRPGTGPGSGSSTGHGPESDTALGSGQATEPGSGQATAPGSAQGPESPSQAPTEHQAPQDAVQGGPSERPDASPPAPGENTPADGSRPHSGGAQNPGGGTPGSGAPSSGIQGRGGQHRGEQSTENQSTEDQNHRDQGMGGVTPGGAGARPDRGPEYWSPEEPPPPPEDEPPADMYDEPGPAASSYPRRGRRPEGRGDGSGPVRDGDRPDPHRTPGSGGGAGERTASGREPASPSVHGGATPSPAGGQRRGWRERHAAAIAAATSGSPGIAPPSTRSPGVDEENFVPGADDESLEDSALYGKAAIERILGGMLIDERSHDTGR